MTFTMRFLGRGLSIVGFGLIVAACASNSNVGQTSGDRTILTTEQFQGKGYSTVYDAVQGLRANWLSPRGTNSVNTPAQVQAYEDGIKLGSAEALKAVEIGPIKYIRYLDANAATARWGTGHAAGAIFISTRPLDASGTKSP